MEKSHPIDPATLWQRFCLEWDRLNQLPPSQDPKILERRRQAQYPWTANERRNAPSDAGADAGA